MTIISIEPPAAEPCSVAEARAFLRLGDQLEDAVIADLIRAARDMIERSLGRLLVARTVDERRPAFLCRGRFRLAMAPVVAVEQAMDANGAVVALDIIDAAEGVVAIAGPGVHGVSGARGVSGGLSLRLRCGYEAGRMPEALGAALKSTVRALHAARDESAGVDWAIVRSLLAPFQRFGL